MQPIGDNSMRPAARSHRIAQFLYGLTAGLLSLFVTLPFLFLAPAPQDDEYGFTFLAIAAIVALLVSWMATRAAGRRRRILFACLCAAALPCIANPLAVRVLGHFLDLDVLIPDVLAGLFGLDGERAYDAALYELWCELWLLFALPFFAVIWLVLRRR
ncbi:hypothetical protein [Trinickia acidisoli]|uniref:hypothetical protein n=1 Tax=Trinickia acidisoli TaxID=2767482 RepID=UPI001A9042C3|nr:hypothetical protein [Trinickia acidisoli]